MTTRTVEQVGDWDTQSFSGGYRGLQNLSDEGFSGIVTAGPTRLCMTKGRVVGILEGDIEDFEGASGTAHIAPSPALPLLAVMQERSDEVRAQYYTEETPVSEVDQTLSDGNFTGFVELSENVLSGDYYLVYHQGRSMSVAFVGESKQLLTDDEAFERANGEVGIYEVKPVDIEVIEIPETDEPADAGPAAAAATADTDAVDEATSEESDTDTETDSDPDRDAGSAEPDSDSGLDESAAPAGSGDSGGDERSTRRESTPEPGADEKEGPDRAAGASQSGSTGRTQESRPDAAGAGQRGAGTAGESQVRGQAQPGQAGASTPPQSRTQSQQGQQEPAAGGQPQGASTQQPAGGQPREVSGGASGSGASVDIETRSIPSLDPDRTSAPSEDTGTEGAAGVKQSPGTGAGAGTGAGQPGTATAGTSTQNGPDAQPRGEAGQQTPPQQGGAQQPPAGQGQRAGTPADDRGGHPGNTGGGAQTPAEGAAGDADQLRAELDEREAEIERLESELDEVEGERDDLEAELEQVRSERDDLEERVEQLERRVNELRTGEGGESVADRRRMSPGEVIDGTNLFIRYKSKGDATLDSAFNGNAEPTAVNDNLEIQHHTQFEAEDVAVNGEPFVDYLHGTLQYAFVEWVVRVLPYEIRDTGHGESLRDLYEALPNIDRAELNGAITVQYEEGGEEHRSQEAFDVVLRDRMGNPLAMANMNESRDPATQSMMESLITAAERVGESKESLAGSFLVTSSFFEPEAMEAAEEATGSGLLSRDKRESFVKLSRKDGFHLCLVQYLDGQFELSVPEL